MAEPLRAPVGQMARRIDAALGPLRPRVPIPGGEPDGYRGFARRGPYDRLLLSEWVLLDEAPDEFVRRASEREHNFYQLDHRSPQRGIRCDAVFDAGPESLGTPRIAHVALLVVLARRAETAGAEFTWCLAQRSAVVHRGVDGQGIRALLDGRSPHVFVAPASTLPLPDERWVVGGPSVRGVVGATAAIVTDLVEVGPEQIEIRIERPGREVAALVLDAPPAECRRQLVLDPLFSAGPDRPQPTTSPNDPSWKHFPSGIHEPIEVRFLSRSCQFAAAFESGHLLVWSLARLPGRGVPRAQVEHPPFEGRTVAYGYANQSPLTVAWLKDGGLGMFGRGFHGSVVANPGPMRGLGHVVPFLRAGFRRRRHLFTDGIGVLWSWNHSEAGADELVNEGTEALSLATTDVGIWAIVRSPETGQLALRLYRDRGEPAFEHPLPIANWATLTTANANNFEQLCLLCHDGNVVSSFFPYFSPNGSAQITLSTGERSTLVEGVFVGASREFVNESHISTLATVGYNPVSRTFHRSPDGARFTVPRAASVPKLSPNGRWVGFITPERSVELWSFDTGSPLMLRSEAP